MLHVFAGVVSQKINNWSLGEWRILPGVVFEKSFSWSSMIRKFMSIDAFLPRSKYYAISACQWKKVKKKWYQLYIVDYINFIHKSFFWVEIRYNKSKS